MKLTFLGTCSGTEPMPGRRHVCFVAEVGGGVYWFDAGEGCSRAAHLMGIDLLEVRAVFITHTHWDHVGGLAGLLWTMQKLAGRSPKQPHKLAGKTVPVFIPQLETWRGMLRMLGRAEGDRPLGFALAARTYGDGDIFDDGDVRVAALHNAHMGTPSAGEPWRSFCFRIEADGRAVVYSGDVAGIEELAALIGDGCDLLLMETGHHRVEDVCEFLRGSPGRVGGLAFIHHGRDVLADPDRERRKAGAILGRDVIITHDGMTLTP